MKVEQTRNISDEKKKIVFQLNQSATTLRNSQSLGHTFSVLVLGTCTSSGRLYKNSFILQFCVDYTGSGNKENRTDAVYIKRRRHLFIYLPSTVSITDIGFLSNYQSIFLICENSFFVSDDRIVLFGMHYAFYQRTNIGFRMSH